MTKIIGVVWLIFVFYSGFAQQRDYFILFKDKAASSYNIERPQEFLSERAISRRLLQRINIEQQDLPVNQSYIEQVQALSPVRYQSKWLNGVVVRTNQTVIEQIRSLPFVTGILWDGDLKNAATSRVNPEVLARNYKFEQAQPADFGLSNVQNTMLGIDKMHEAGFTGTGVLIGVFDSGFSNAQNLGILRNLFTETRVETTWDFVNDEPNVYNDHSHGTNVLSVMAANQPGQFVGTAPNANFALFTTEDVFSETRIEELYWLLAAEKADSLGVDIINSSLGYYSFDNPTQNYPKTALDGNTTLITKAADWAAAKGIIVVTSAGNEGRSAWENITAPADADSVIAVGAVTSNGEYVAFSSIGPSADGRVKPELAAMGLSTTVGRPNNSVGTSNGTSFSSPLVAGLAAGMRQAFPSLSAMQIRELLIKSGSQSDNPDSFLGYGIPNFERANELATFEQLLADSGETLFIYPNPVSPEFSLKAVINDADFSQPFTIQLFDSLGRLLSENSAETLRFSFSDEVQKLPAGMYIVKVVNQEKSITKRFIKQ